VYSQYTTAREEKVFSITYKGNSHYFVSNFLLSNISEFAGMLAPFFLNSRLEAGLDEAGRGCYAGPVFAAAVILPQDFHHPLLNDSKQLKEKERDLLRPLIEKEAISFAVSQISHEEIDQINILKASIKAMHQAVSLLKKKPGLLLVDGNRFIPYKKIPHQCFVKGDCRFASIAAASVLAKTYRDEWMEKLHVEFPHYGWDRNKGYGTAQHRTAIEKWGLCTYHRKSFRLLPDQQNYSSQ
jgi:ribonuclease HII